MRPRHTSIGIHSPILFDRCEKKGNHVSLHSPITAAREVMADSSPVSWASSHFLSILKAPWKRLAWGYLQQSRETQTEGGHVKHTFMTSETDGTHSTSPSLKEKNREKKWDWNINRAALGGLDKAWRDRPRGGFATSPTHSLVRNQGVKKCKRVSQTLGLRC